MPDRRTLRDCRALLAAGEYGALSEREWQALVRQEAELQGWLVYAVYDSRRSPEGWPDLFMVRPEAKGSEITKGLALELKSEKGRPTSAQLLWIEVLRRIPGVTAMVARPRDWRRVETLLDAEAGVVLEAREA